MTRALNATGPSKMRKNADNIFTFGVGTFLIVASQNAVEIWTIAHWILLFLIIAGAIVSIVIYGGFSIFWIAALKRLDIYGPNCELHEFAMKAFKNSAESVAPYKHPILLGLSFAGSLTLMSGLLLQGWYIALGFEILGSAIGYGFIHYFQINRNIILGQITGDDKVTE